MDNMLVAKVMAKTGVEQRNGLKRLKNLGSFKHNILTFSRRDMECFLCSYLPCSKCYGFFHKYELWRHACPCDDNAADVPTIVNNIHIYYSFHLLLLYIFK